MAINGKNAGIWSLFAVFMAVLRLCAFLAALRFSCGLYLSCDFAAKKRFCTSLPSCGLNLRELGKKFLAADLGKKLVEVLVVLKIEGHRLFGALSGELDLSA